MYRSHLKAVLNEQILQAVARNLYFSMINIVIILTVYKLKEGFSVWHEGNFAVTP